MKNILTMLVTLLLVKTSLGQYTDYSIIHSYQITTPESASSIGHYFSNTDWDNDGDLDAMFGPAYLIGGQNLYMLENTGFNTFAGTLTTIYEPETADTYTQYHFGHLDTDAAIDLVTIEPQIDVPFSTNTINCFVRGSSGELILISTITDLPGNSGVDPSFDLKLLDLNGDGLDDMVYFCGSPIDGGNTEGTNVDMYIYFNQGNGLMTEHQHFTFSSASSYATEAAQILFADINNDNLVDIQTMNFFPPLTIEVYLSDVNHNYTATTETDNQVFVPIDFNGDDLEDLLLYADLNEPFLMNQAVVRINDGSGGYLQPQAIALLEPIYGNPNGFLTAASSKFVVDVNADGYDDLFLDGNIHINYSGVSFNTPLNLGDAGNVTDVPILINPSPFGDFNQDGYPDLIGGEYFMGEELMKFYYFTNCGENCLEITPGCMDETACNYDPDATTDSGTCDYTCEGCTDPFALNYSETATTDNGTCVYFDNGHNCITPVAVSCGQYIYGSTVGYPGDASSLIGFTCGVTGTGGQSWYSFTSTFTGEVTFSTVDEFTTNFDTKLHVYTGDCGSLVCVGYNDDFNGMQAQITIDAAAGETYLIRLGGFAAQEGSYLFSITCENPGCMDEAACNYYPEALFDDGSCEYCSCNPLCGCTNPEACNYDSQATIDDGTCYTQLIVGAPEDVSICPGTLQAGSFTVPFGIPVTAAWSTESGSTIYYPDSLYFYAEIMATSTFTINVTDEFGCTAVDSFLVTVEDCVYGCIDLGACNYNPLANQSDGSCDYTCIGCTDIEALNYSEFATIDDGSCYFEGEGNTCFNPIALSCAEGVYENMIVGVANDNITSGSMVCGGNSTGGQRWYVYQAPFNSEVTISTINAGTNFDTYLKVFTGSCGNLTCVTQNDDIMGTGFQSQVVFNAIAGETYLVRVGGFVIQQGSFVLTFECGGGCLDEAACNYEPGAPFEDGSCTYGDDCYGCTDPDAENYSPIAVYDEGCQYQPNIFVYHDMNGNGVHNNGEPGLSNWPVYIPAMAATIYTNASGYIDVNLPASSFTIQVINNTENWISSTPSEIMIDVPDDMSGSFGMIPATGETFFVAGPYDGFWDIIHCNNGYESGVLINNTGSTSLTGTLTMTCDELFTPEADQYGTVAPDQVAPGFAQWNISGYTAGSNQLFSMHIDGPGVDNIGATYPFQFNLVLVDGNGNEIYNNSWTTTPFIACAYDPNDITATPVGLYDPHFILPGERLQYRIRFQNTGNFYAEDITIMDQLDASVFDLSTFQPQYSSADMVACLHDDGLVDFIFNDIYLPDSTTDEEGSHGFVVYMVEARADLAPNTVLYNQAAIFFEQNPAIITNQVFHTIFDCSSFAGITGDTQMCEGETFNLSAEQQYVETYSWQVDGNLFNGPVLELDGLSVGSHIVDLNTSNPLCDADHAMEIVVSETPIIEAGEDITICEGNTLILNATSDSDIVWSNSLANGSEYSPLVTEVLTATATSSDGCVATDEILIQVSPLPMNTVALNGDILTASEGSAWQWYFNGEIIEGATDQSLTTSGGGSYYVLITNSDGCSVTSQEVMVVGTQDLSTEQILVYPNPMAENTRIVLPSGLNRLTITDALGKVVLTKDNCSGTMNLNKSEFASGVYHLRVEQNNKNYTTKLIVN